MSNLLKKEQPNEQEITLLPEFSYALISTDNIAICKSPDKLYHALNTRKNYYCEVYAMEDTTLLQNLVHQKAPEHYYCNNAGEGNIAIQLPAISENANCYYCLQNNSTLIDGTIIHPQHNYPILVTSPQFIDTGFWAISGLNGYYTSNSINSLINVLMSDTLDTPVARWFPDSNQATWAGRQDYVKRFYQHYSATVENILLPAPLTLSYFDQLFEQREERLKSNKTSYEFLAKLYNLGL